MVLVARILETFLVISLDYVDISCIKFYQNRSGNTERVDRSHCTPVSKFGSQ
jgi:hypothetical protein